MRAPLLPFFSAREHLPLIPNGSWGRPVELLSIGGTYRLLRGAGLAVTQLADQLASGFPELLDSHWATRFVDPRLTAQLNCATSPPHLRQLAELQSRVRPHRTAPHPHPRPATCVHLRHTHHSTRPTRLLLARQLLHATRSRPTTRSTLTWRRRQGGLRPIDMVVLNLFPLGLAASPLVIPRLAAGQPSAAAVEAAAIEQVDLGTPGPPSRCQHCESADTLSPLSHWNPPK